ncbi:Cytochrome c oxidase subunit 5A_ mitochondrial, partial [Caligus rogercresseyi]
MFRSLVAASSRVLSRSQVQTPAITGVRCLNMRHHEIYQEDFESKVIAYLERPELDGWEARKAFHTVYGLDMVPDPSIIIAGLKACRRLNDFGLAIRFLEATKAKCISNEETIWPYIMQ